MRMRSRNRCKSCLHEWMPRIHKRKDKENGLLKDRKVGRGITQRVKTTLIEDKRKMDRGQENRGKKGTWVNKSTILSIDAKKRYKDDGNRPKLRIIDAKKDLHVKVEIT